MVRHPVGDRGEIPIDRNGVASRLLLGSVELVLVPGNPDVHTGGTALSRVELLRNVTRVLDGMVGALQELTLLRIHGGRLPRRDVKEQGVESLDLVQESSPTHIGAVTLRVPGVGFRGPARRRYLTYRVTSGSEVAPELVHVPGSRVASGETDDGDVVGACRWRSWCDLMVASFRDRPGIWLLSRLRMGGGG